MRKNLIVGIGIVFIVLTGTVLYYFIFKESNKQNLVETKVTRSECLGEEETADFLADEKYSFKYPKFPVVVYVKDKNTGKEKFNFQIDNVNGSYHAIEIHKCGVYVIRKLPTDNRVELWLYDYGGTQKKILSLFDYSYDFRVDPYEQYIVLIRGYMGLLDYALIIKNFQLDKDEFVLLRQSLLEKYPDFFGTFGLKSWTKNGDAFWARLFAGAYTEAFLRIMRDTWKVDVLPAPDGVLGGAALNVERGYVTQVPSLVWTGVDVLTEELKKEWTKQGKISYLYLFNLLTKNRILLSTTTEPLWSFKPQWLSDTEFQYEMPTGEKKIYKINDK